MSETKSKPQQRWKKILTLLTLIAFGALIYFTRHQIVDTFRNLNEVNLGFLFLIIPLRFINFHAYTKLYQQLFAILDQKINYRSMYRIAVELNFVNSVFPSGGVSGFSYFGVRMRKEGVSAGKATLVQILRFITIFIAFQVLLFVGLIILAVGGQANHLMVLVAGSLSTLLLVGTITLLFIVGSKQRINTFFSYITRGINRFLKNFNREPETINLYRVHAILDDLHENYRVIRTHYKSLKMPLAYAMLVNITDILTIYAVYMSFGSFVNIGAVIIAYAVANFAGLISVLPGGVGIYEGLMTAILVAGGVPAGTSIPVTVMYRILTMTMQLPIGYYFYHQTIYSSDTDELKPYGQQ